MPLRKNSSLKSLLQIVLNSTPALFRAGVQVEHSDQPRPLARPVGDGQNGAAMALQPGENVVAVLPDRFHYDDGRIRIKRHEDIHAHALVVDKSVTQFSVERIGTADL